MELGCRNSGLFLTIFVVILTLFVQTEANWFGKRGMFYSRCLSYGFNSTLYLIFFFFLKRTPYFIKMHRKKALFFPMSSNSLFFVCRIVVNYFENYCWILRICQNDLRVYSYLLIVKWVCSAGENVQPKYKGYDFLSNKQTKIIDGWVQHYPKCLYRV